MFCPQCGLQTNEDIKFCRKCGANLKGVQDALMGRSTSSTKGFDWDKTWIREMLMSQEERERRQGITPEVKRMNEVKGGVITASVGLAAMIFLYNLLGAVAANEPPHDARIIENVWLAGLVPFLVGLAILFNGLVVSKRIVRLKKEQQEKVEETISQRISAMNTAQLPEAEPPRIPDYSITEQTTYRLPQQPNKELQ